MRVPNALAALTLSAGLLLTLPGTASAQVVPQLQTTVVEPVPGTGGTLPPPPVEPVITVPTAAPAPPPVLPAPTASPAPAPVLPVPVPVPSDLPEPAPAPPSPLPAPAATPAPSPSSAPSSPAATSGPVTTPPTDPDGGTTAPAEADGARLQEAGRSEGMPAGAVVAPRGVRAPAVSSAPAPRSAVPATGAPTSEAAAAPGTDDAGASSRLPATGPAARYVAAGVLSVIAVLIAIAIAVVAQPRRPRHTH